MATDEVAVGVVTIRGVAATIIAAAATIFVLHEGAALFVPIFLSVLLAYALEPFVAALTRLRINRFLAAALVYLMLAMALAAGARAARDQIIDFLDDLPATIASLRQAAMPQPGDPGADNRPDALDRLQAATRELHEALAPRSPSPPDPGDPGDPGNPGNNVARVVPVRRPFDVRAYLMQRSASAVYLAGRAFVVAFLTFLLLATGDLYKRKLVKLAGPHWEQQKLTRDIIRTIDRQVERYLVVRVLISVIVTVATGAGLWMLGVSHALVWGAVAGVLNVLPIVGPITGIVLITIAAGLQFRTLEMTAAAGGWATLVAALEGNLVTPLLTGHAAELNTVGVFVSVLFWGWMWGMWGLLLAVPIMVAIKAAADHIEPLQPLGELLGR